MGSSEGGVGGGSVGAATRWEELEDRGLGELVEVRMLESRFHRGWSEVVEAHGGGWLLVELSQWVVEEGRRRWRWWRGLRAVGGGSVGVERGEVGALLAGAAGGRGGAVVVDVVGPQGGRGAMWSRRGESGSGWLSVGWRTSGEGSAGVELLRA